MRPRRELQPEMSSGCLTRNILFAQGEGLQNIKDHFFPTTSLERKEGKSERSPPLTTRDGSVSVGFIYISVLGNLSQFVSLQMM